MSGLFDKGKEFLSGSNNNDMSTQGTQGNEDYLDKGGLLMFLPGTYQTLTACQVSTRSKKRRACPITAA